jgi:Effector-associated domain 1
MAYINLTGKQQLSLRDALYDAFDPEALRDLVQSLNHRFHPYQDKYQVLALVEEAEQGLWLADLVAAAIKARPGDLVLAKFEEELISRALPADFDPFDICCLSGEFVLVDRRDLRLALKAMSRPDGKRILLVRDKKPPAKDAALATKTGKSMTVQFISALNQQLGGFELVWVDLEKFGNDLGKGVPITARDLGLKLMRQLRYTIGSVPAEPTDLQWSRWNTEFWDEFESQARNHKSNVWIVIDEFNKVALPQGTLDLVKKLADGLRVTLHNFRLVLLGYGDTFEPALRGVVEEERIERVIPVHEVVDFFLRAAAQRRLNFPDAIIEEAAEETLKGLNADLDVYLEEIGRRAYAKLSSLVATGGKS